MLALLRCFGVALWSAAVLCSAALVSPVSLSNAQNREKEEEKQKRQSQRHYGAPEKPRAPNAPTAPQVRRGEILLFDGESTFGWKVAGEAKVEKGVLILG